MGKNEATIVLHLRHLQANMLLCGTMKNNSLIVCIQHFSTIELVSVAEIVQAAATSGSLQNVLELTRIVAYRLLSLKIIETNTDCASNPS